MKKLTALITVLVLSLLLVIGSCKKDNSQTVTKEKYAWVTGATDSTGYGTILFTPDAGETWDRQGVGNPALEGIGFEGVWAIDKNTVWVTGNKNTLLKTTDGGLNWTKVTLPAQLPDADLSCVNIYKKTNIWIGGAVGTTGIIYRSNDGGNTFTLLDTTFFHRKPIQGIWTTESNVIYVAGGYTNRAETGFIDFSTNNGITWDSIVLNNDFNKWEWIDIVSSENTILVYGAKGHYVVSTDGGTSWNNDSIPLSGGVGGADINHMIMLDTKTWWAACDLGNMWITTDGGNNWTQKAVPGNVSNSFLVGLDTWDRNIALIVASGFYPPFDGPILKTSDGGEVWKTAYTNDVRLWKISFIRD